MEKLTLEQKLIALEHKYYQCQEWIPKAGDYYTTSRADIELYQIVSADSNVISTRYCDPSKGTEVSPWVADTFLKGFGEKRVWVPDFVLGL